MVILSITVKFRERREEALYKFRDFTHLTRKARMRTKGVRNENDNGAKQERRRCESIRDVGDERLQRPQSARGHGGEEAENL